MNTRTSLVPAPRLIWLVAALAFPVAAAAGVWTPARPAAIGLLALIAALALIDALSRGRALNGIRMEVPELVRMFKDRNAEVRVRVHNAGQARRRIRVGIVAPQGLETSLEEHTIDLPEGAGAAEFLWTWIPHRRGQYQVTAGYLEAASPLGLWSVRRRDVLAMEIRVYPNLRRRDDLRALRRGTDGAHALRQLGRGREFEKLREYVPGDGFDEIHWKATARRGHPITKVFQVERTQEIYVVVDASRLSARPVGEETVLDRALAAALLVGAAAEQRGDLFGLAAFSDRVETFLRAKNGKTHYAACRDAVYQIHPRPVSPDFDEIATFLRLRLRRRAMVLFLTSLDDSVLAENFILATRLLGRRHLVMAGMPRPESAQPLFHDARVESSEDIYRHLAGHLSWKRLREVEATLARQGVRLVLFDPEKFAPGLISLYDEVKQRQLL